MTFRKVLLGNIAKEDRVMIKPDTDEAKRRPYLGLEQIESQTGRITSYDNDSIEGKSTTFAFDNRHVLYGKLRPYLNKVAMPETEGRCSTEIIPLLPVDIDRDYLALLLRTEALVNAAMSKKTGSRMPRADMSMLFGFTVTIHTSIEEQRRIAAALKAQLAEVEKARAELEAQCTDIEKLKSAILQQTFADIAETNYEYLDNALLRIESGKSFQTLETLATENQLGVLKVSAVTWSEFKPTQAKAIENYTPNDKHRVSARDLLMSRANTKELVGAVVLVERDYPNRLLSDKTLRLVTDDKKVDKDYLIFALRAPAARKHIEHYATGSSESMCNISQKVILDTPIWLPELPIQQRIAAALKEQLAEVDKARHATVAQLAEIKGLPARLLAQAFGA